MIGTCRSGSTALLHALSQHPDVECVYQPIKSGLRMSGQPNYAFFEQESEGDHRFLAAKETIGHKDTTECTLQVFPNKETYKITRPCFIFRDPVSTYGSWRILGWGNMELFEISYWHTFNLFVDANQASGYASAIIYEDLIADPETIMRQLCEKWELPYNDLLVNWERSLGKDSPIQRWVHEGSSKGFEAEHHAKLRESRTFTPMEGEKALPLDQAELVRRKLASVYEAVKDSPANLKNHP